VPPRPSVGPTTVSALAISVVAVSSSAPLIAYAAAPALAIAFWRNAMGVAAVGPVALVRRRGELAGLFGQREGAYSLLAGLVLAVHFALWIPSAKLTTVATATALVATQPVWQGLIAVGQGRRLSAAMWLGIGLAVVGAAVTTGADMRSSAVAGDLLAIGGGIAAAVYAALGERVRVSTSTTAYTTVCYSVCAVVLLAVCLVSRQPLTGYPATAWLALIGLTVGPQLLGHSLLNFSLRRVAATTVSVVVLLEVPGAALIGWIWLGQTPRAATLPGLALLLAGVVLVLLASRPRRQIADALV
jgi:drug/metabolite transporter (DMT)-like permease